MKKKAAAKATAPKKVLLSFIQDRSGSMANVWEETLSGFKTYVKDMQADQAKDNEVEYIFSLTAFDTQIDKPYLGVPIASVDGETLTKFGPRGGTALYDAVGKTLQAIDDDKSITFDKAIVIICTDGEENQSREWSKDSLHAAIDERIKRGNWTFTYLGTQPETWAAASSLGVGVGASATYNAQNAGATYATMATASMNMARSVQTSSTSFLHDNTTPQMRASVGMTTALDDDPNAVKITTTVPLATTTFLYTGSGLSNLGTSPAPVRHVPRHTPPPVNRRKWK
jgi:uncharacterized protein YegL